MSETQTFYALRRYFTFPFEGIEWQKRFLIGAALILLSFFIPILPAIFVCGYIVQVMRQTIAGHDLALPAWEDLGKLGLDGLRFCAVGLVFLLPGLLAYFGGMSLYMLASLFLPFAMQLAEAGRILYTMIPLFFISAMIILFITIFLGTTLTLLGTVPLPMAIAHFVKQDEIGAAFRFREWWPLLWHNKVVYLAAWALCGGLMGISYYGIMILYTTMILCVLIPLVSAPLLFYCMLVWAATFGKVYQESVALLVRPVLSP